MANFDLAISKTLDNEGYLSDNQSDNGGITKYGISKKAYPNEDIINLTLDRAKELYKRDYWDKVKGDAIYSQNIAESIFDFAVNSGVGTSAKIAQRVIGVQDDGVIGANTIASLNSFNEKLFISLFTIEKIKRYRDICLKNPTQKKFFFGWVTRTLR